MFLEDIFKEFKFNLEIENYSPRTIKGYINNNRKFLDYLNNEHKIDQLDQLKPIHIKSYLMFHKRNKRKPTYINNIFKNVRSLLKYCVDEDYIQKEENPALKVGWMREDKTVIKTFNDDEVKRMLGAFHAKDYLNARNKLILLMFIDTGIRNLELCELTNMQILDNVILIRGKGAKERYVFISPFLKKFIIRYERAKKGFFKDRVIQYDNYFLSNNCRPLTREVNMRIVKFAAEHANVRKEIRASPHTLRHFFSQKMLESTDVYSVSRLLGHEDITTTKIYLDSMEDERILNETRDVSPLMKL